MDMMTKWHQILFQIKNRLALSSSSLSFPLHNINILILLLISMYTHITLAFSLSCSRIFIHKGKFYFHGGILYNPKLSFNCLFNVLYVPRFLFVHFSLRNLTCFTSSSIFFLYFIPLSCIWLRPNQIEKNERGAEPSEKKNIQRRRRRENGNIG